MMTSRSVGNLMNAIVPISRFNKGEANKIFDEVSSHGFKLAIKNNKPACVLVSIEKYQEMLDTLEDYKLFVEAEKRMEKAKTETFVSEKEVLERYNISQEDLTDTEVDIE